MADHRNQHFVPRAHLRPFSADATGRAINVHLLRSGRTVLGAPVRGQCARPYLYGRDGVLERLLSRFEERYAEVVRGLSDDAHRLDDGDMYLLRYFTLLQSLRTAEQIGRTLAQMERWASFARLGLEAHGGSWDQADDPSSGVAMTVLMQAFNDQLQSRVLDDLKVVVLRNRTGRDFVTSDDPAVTTNRWLIQRRRIRTFGTNAAGVVLALPLGPRLLAMAYDPAVYSVVTTGRPGFVDVVREGDVLAFNEHQYMRAAEAVYFRDARDAALVAAEVEATRPFRPAAWDTFTVARRAGGTATHDWYDVGTPEDVAPADGALIHSAREWPSPPRWPSVLAYRAGAHGFTRGRAIVRRSAMVRGAAGGPPWTRVR